VHDGVEVIKLKGPRFRFRNSLMNSPSGHCAEFSISPSTLSILATPSTAHVFRKFDLTLVFGCREPEFGLRFATSHVCEFLV